MVHAVQAGRKTQTRRAMYPQPDRIAGGRFYRNDGREIVCPFGSPGDRLWVRERFAFAEDGSVIYAADPVKGRSRVAWQQSRHLPRHASRLTLRVLSTRPQRLQEINDADARAEGYDPSRESLSPIDWFARLWDRLTPIESLRWAANPWMWVVHFEVMPARSNDLIAEVNEAKDRPMGNAASLFDHCSQPVDSPAKPSARTPRTATREEKQRLVELLRSRAPM
jgi:hypothetical protein